MLLRTGSTLLCLLALGACVPAARQNVQNQSPTVTFAGSFASSGGTTAIYFGNQTMPLTTTSDASFTVEVPRDVIERSEDRRLYFYSSLKEAAATREILDYDIGVKTLEPITLAPEVLLTGTVLADSTPVPDAIITVGRRQATSAANGSYSIQAPLGAALPVLVQKTGYVLTKALWAIALPETRNFHVYPRLGPNGTISIPVSERIAQPSLPLAIEGTLSAYYVRISRSPITAPAAYETGWMSLAEPITLSADDLAQPMLYYQFAGKDKDALGPMQVLKP